MASPHPSQTLSATTTHQNPLTRLQPTRAVTKKIDQTWKNNYKSSRDIWVDPKVGVPQKRIYGFLVEGPFVGGFGGVSIHGYTLSVIAKTSSAG